MQEQRHITILNEYKSPVWKAVRPVPRGRSLCYAYERLRLVEIIVQMRNCIPTDDISDFIALPSAQFSEKSLA